MRAPGIQRFGPALLLQGPDLCDVAALVALGLRYRAQVDGAPVTARQRSMLDALNTAAEESLSALRHVCGTGETADAADSAWSEGWVGSGEAADLLQITPRQVRNLAGDLDGRVVRGAWRFDRAAVIAAAHRRAEGRVDD